MKITKQLLKQIIKEELENTQTTSSRQLFEEIKKICEEALMNKSMGINPKIEKMYKDKILDLFAPPFVDGVPVKENKLNEDH